MRLKRIFFVLFLLGFVGCGQELEIPIKVSKNFWYKYENAKETEWSKLDSIYSVSFSLNNFPKLASFKSNGEWLQTTSYLPPRRSMVCVRDFVDERYNGSTIIETVFIDSPIFEKYFVTIEKGITGEDGDSTEVQDDFENSDRQDVESPMTIVLEFNSDCDFVGEKP